MVGNHGKSKRAKIIVNNYQKQKLVELFDRQRHPLIDIEDHREIDAQINSLPPGIKKQLRQGKGLPPGIDKKVILDRDVVDYIGVDSSRYDIVVIDSNVVLREKITSVVQGILYDLFVR